MQHRLVVGERRQLAAVGALVAGADLERVETAEDVELGDDECRHAVDAGRVAQRHEVGPAAAPRAARRGAELAAALAQFLADLVVQFGRERPGPDARRVGLGDAPDLGDVARADTGADTGSTGDGVGRGDEGVGAVVDVQQRGLRALEDHELLVVERAVQQRSRVSDVLLQAVPVEQVLLGHRVQIERRVALERAQHQLLRLQRGHDLLLEDLLVEQVLDADAQTRCLVGVAGADAAFGRADLELSELGFAGVIEHQVVRHDQVRVGADAQVAHVHAALAQTVDLRRQDRGVDNDAVADDAGRLGVEDPGGDQVELEGLLAAHDRMAGVVAALEAHHGCGALGQQVYDLALTFIAPLGANDRDTRHNGEAV